MTSLYTWDNKLLVVDGKLASNVNCCCGSCCQSCETALFDVYDPGTSMFYDQELHWAPTGGTVYLSSGEACEACSVEGVQPETIIMFQWNNIDYYVCDAAEVLSIEWSFDWEGTNAGCSCWAAASGVLTGTSVGVMLRQGPEESTAEDCITYSFTAPSPVMVERPCACCAHCEYEFEEWLEARVTDEELWEPLLEELGDTYHPSLEAGCEACGPGPIFKFEWDAVEYWVCTDISNVSWRLKEPLPLPNSNQCKINIERFGDPGYPPWPKSNEELEVEFTCCCWCGDTLSVHSDYDIPTDSYTLFNPEQFWTPEDFVYATQSEACLECLDPDNVKYFIWNGEKYYFCTNFIDQITWTLAWSKPESCTLTSTEPILIGTFAGIPMDCSDWDEPPEPLDTLCGAGYNINAPVVADLSLVDCTAACNDCDPCLSNRMTVTISGLIDPWDVHNGSYEVELTACASCTWVGADHQLVVQWDEVNTVWQASLSFDGICTSIFTNVGGDCSPTSGYTRTPDLCPWGEFSLTVSSGV